MFALFRLRYCLLVLSCGLTFSSIAARPDQPGHYADTETRHIAVFFPGRMAGSPAELMTADYLNQQFHDLGYRSDIRQQNTGYRWQPRTTAAQWQKVTATSVIAGKSGQQAKDILVIAHLDTRIAGTPAEQQQNIGGLRLQGVDNNAAGLGIMLELAKQLAGTHSDYGIRFVALSATENNMQGMENYFSRMSDEEKHNTLLVINLNQLVAGRRLELVSGANTSATERAPTAGKAMAIARQLHIPLHARQLTGTEHQQTTPFDQAGIPYLLVTAEDNNHRHPTALLDDKTSRDNLETIDQKMPGRLATRCRQAVQILLPLLKQLSATAG
ncbi:MULTISPECIES: aminopeptidase [unclassified Tatumella]|uniref:aminopeptidase n=1 Tax=unclassified Tatumella TaxID=2649542 RepID=UPI001BB09BE4|nr:MULTISPECIES: aminopeptidase [unclassified Tatumella]MBS0877012.1 aminopeptidase [Tatumella sp. JGM82]MBS0890851.1 aminopeptidase [Tatumella sp. JGM94]MBS0901904.1 aminopeptidase [Tatumella sp. JGM100]